MEGRRRAEPDGVEGLNAIRRRPGIRAVAALGCALLAGCEAVPEVRFRVTEADGATPIVDAIVLHARGRPQTAPEEMAERLRDDRTVTTRMHPYIGFEGDGYFAMRTGPDGEAVYSELRLMCGFSVPDPVHRDFYVWALDHEMRAVPVEVGTESTAIDVTLDRASDL